MTELLTATHWGAYYATVDNGRIVGVRPFENDPHPSPIGASLVGAADHRARVSAPMVRKGWLENGPSGKGRGEEPFVAVSWEEATRLVARELARVRQAYGNEAIYGGSYGWASAGRFHHPQSQLKRFLNLHGGFTSSLYSYSFGAGYVILPRVIGKGNDPISNFTSLDVVAEHSKILLMLGGAPYKNTQVEAGGVGRHVVPELLRRCRDNGVRILNVSPIRDDIDAEIGAEWICIRPNTDTAFLLGIAHVVRTEGLHDEAFLARYCVGFERFESYLLGEADGVPKSPEWAAPICGVDADVMRSLARALATGRSLISIAWALQRAHHGEQPYWMTITLAAMLGQIGLPGGGFAVGYGAMASVGVPGPRFSGPAVPQGRNAVGTSIPVARITELLERPGGTMDFDGQVIGLPDIRLVYWAGGNPFHHHQDLNRFRQAWLRPETVIAHEQVWNGLAKNADIVLPATYTFERNDLSVSSRDSHMFASRQVVAPFGEARNDFDIFAAISAELGFRDRYTEGRDEMQWIRWLYDGFAQTNNWLPPFEEFWEKGHVEIPRDKVERASSILMEDFRRDPAAHPLTTPSGKIEIFSADIAACGYADCPGHAAWLEPAEWLGSAKARNYPLHLMSNQPSGKLHSQLDFGAASLGTKAEGREPIAMNPADAAARGIGHGDIVRVFSSRGQCLATAHVTSGIGENVVRISTGSWLDFADIPGGDALETHGNPNVLTLDIGTSRLGQGTSANTCLVQVEKFAGTPPPVRAFDPPPIVGRRHAGADR